MQQEEMWKRVCEAWYSVAPNVLEELDNSMPKRTGMLLCFIGMYLNIYVGVFSLESI